MFNYDEYIKELEIENYKLKKQLEIAVYALKSVRKRLLECESTKIIDKALEQITAEQKDVK